MSNALDSQRLLAEARESPSMILVPITPARRVVLAANGWRNWSSEPSIQRADSSIISKGGKQNEPDHWVLSSWNSVGLLSKDTFDVAVLRADVNPELIGREEPRGQFLRETFEALKRGGMVMLHLPPNPDSIRSRYRLRQSLLGAGFENLEFYLSEGGDEDFTRIVPFSKNPSWAIRHLCATTLEGEQAFRARLKRAAKRILFPILGIHNPFYGLLAVGHKPAFGGQRPARSLCETVVEVVRRNVNLTGAPAFVLHSRPLGKQLLFVYDSAQGDLVAVAKLARQDSRMAWLLERECRNLARLYPLAHNSPGMKVTVPQILHSDTTGPIAFYVSTGAKGKKAAHLLAQHLRKSDRRAAQEMLRELVGVLKRLHEEMGRQRSPLAFSYDRRYRENYLGIPHDLLGQDWADALREQSIQHGDFKVEHVYVDSSRKTWEVIDWEWAGGGYPPLFDMFSLIRTAGLLSLPKGNKTWKEFLYDSFIRTFFLPGWINAYLKELLYEYCRYFGIDKCRTFEYFVQYILFWCNRLRLHPAEGPRAVEGWERLLKYAVGHREEFGF